MWRQVDCVAQLIKLWFKELPESIFAPQLKPIVDGVRANRRDDDVFFADEDAFVRSAFAIINHEWEDEVLTVMDECFKANGEIPCPYASGISNLTQFFMEIPKI